MTVDSVDHAVNDLIREHRYAGLDRMLGDMLAERGLADFERDVASLSDDEEVAIAKRIIGFARGRIIANGEAALIGIRGLAMPAHEQALEQVLDLAKKLHAEASR
jgi:hypothetical protein